MSLAEFHRYDEVGIAGGLLQASVPRPTFDGTCKSVRAEMEDYFNTPGMFLAGISGHTIELCMILMLIHDDANINLAPIVAVIGLIWMISYGHHSYREIVLGALVH